MCECCTCERKGEGAFRLQNQEPSTSTSLEKYQLRETDGRLQRLKRQRDKQNQSGSPRKKKRISGSRTSISLKKSSENGKNSTFSSSLRSPPSSPYSCSSFCIKSKHLKTMRSVLPQGTNIKDVRIVLHNIRSCRRGSTVPGTQSDSQCCKLRKEVVVRLQRQNLRSGSLRLSAGSSTTQQPDRSSSPSSPLARTVPLAKDAKDRSLNPTSCDEDNSEGELLVECSESISACSDPQSSRPITNAIDSQLVENFASSPIDSDWQSRQNLDVDLSVGNPQPNALVSPVDSNPSHSEMLLQIQEAEDFSPAASVPENTASVSNDPSSNITQSDLFSPKKLGLTRYITVNLSKSRVTLPDENTHTPSPSQSLATKTHHSKGKHSPQSGHPHDSPKTTSSVITAPNEQASDHGTTQPLTRSYASKVFSLRSRPVQLKNKEGLAQKESPLKAQRGHLDFNGHVRGASEAASARPQKRLSAPHRLFTVEMQLDPKLSLKPYVELGLNNNLKRRHSVTGAHECLVPVGEGAVNTLYTSQESEILTAEGKKKNLAFNPFKPSKRLRLVVTNGSIDLDIASTSSDESN